MNESPWEDNLLERKVESDLKDIRKTLVAFANSVKPGHTAILLIGETDEGAPAGVKNPDSIQKTIHNECKRIYPPIIYRVGVYERGGCHCVRVEVEYSGETPHFAGPAYIRRGSISVEASDQLFQTLIDLRSSKVFELSKWIDKEITIIGDRSALLPTSEKKWSPLHSRWSPYESEAIPIFVNQHWATFRWSDRNLSEPLGKLTLTFDDKHERLKIIVTY